MGGKSVFTVPNKSVINFKSGFGKKLLCDDMTFTTGTACQYSCSFCYVESQTFKMNAWHKKHGVVGNHSDIVIRRANPIEVAREQLKNAKDKDKPLVIYASPLVDVAANMDLVRETVEMCKLIFAETNWHIRLLSKSNLLPKIAEALDAHPGPFLKSQFSYSPRSRVIYGVSTGTLDDKLAQAFEEGCPLVSKRIASLHWLQDNGFRTFGMICPSLPQESWRAYRDFSIACRDAIRAERCEHIWAEPINVRGESFERTLKALVDAGFDNEAVRLDAVMRYKDKWEDYARWTFQAHATDLPIEKLRFLQYVNKSNEAWWTQPGVVKL